jgi:cytochrome P450
VASAVEETLRHDPPLIGWLRCTTRDTELSGVPVPAGSRLLLLLGSAALDEAHGVVNSHVFDPMRVAQPANPVFGAGIHYCPGASYARLVARLAITELAGVCPDLALTEPTAAGPDNWPGNAALRSPAHLTVRW